MSGRVGIGYDVHRFGGSRPLVLGGVAIPHSQGLAGHSDADVLLHAIIDALLGAAALGDIGQHFPADGPTYRDADSRDLLARTLTLVQGKGYRVANVDATVIAQRPRLAPHIAAMRHCIAQALGVEVGEVSVKATTNEGMDALGRGEGIAAFAVALLTKT
ncbi:MAG: 2-C-methyl-D-erythritol 2,4-cyclodiphosphate synthase [Dehalococcoidia bacterium]